MMLNQKSEEEEDSYKLRLKSIRVVILKIDDLIHIMVAFFLLLAGLFVIVKSLFTLRSIESSTILYFINDMLFVIIILELLWTVLAYLKRKQFPIVSFIFIGIISSIRRILMIEAQTSFSFMKSGEGLINKEMIELGIYSIMIMILALSYYLLAKVPHQE
jgi:uncharacterized membrane protein (DUF373 family)